jgi:hypothetical protein
VQGQLGEDGNGELHYAPAVPFQVRLRPSFAYVWLLLLGAALVAVGINAGGIAGALEIAGGAIFVFLVGARS